MEIMLNGQLVTCSPKEYKELMDMGLIPGQPAGTKAATQLDDGWKDQLAELAKRYPKIEPEKPKFGTCTVTPLYGCTIPAEEAKKTFYEVHLIDKKQMKHGYLSKYAPDSISPVQSSVSPRHPLYTDSISEALIFTSEDAARRFIDDWNDYKSHAHERVVFQEIEIPPNAILTYRELGRVEIEDFKMDMHNISIAAKPKSTETTQAYVLQFTDTEEPTYLAKDSFGKLILPGGDGRTQDLSKAMAYLELKEARDAAGRYNDHSVKPLVKVVSKEIARIE